MRGEVKSIRSGLSTGENAASVDDLSTHQNDCLFACGLLAGCRMRARLVRISSLVGCALLGASSLVRAAMDPVVAAVVEHCRSHSDGRAAFSVPLPGITDAQERAALPIGVFDSGVGGLTVLESILKLDAFHNDTLSPGPDGRPDFENERFVYFGDQANMPYGNYSAAGRTDYLRELILKDALFLLGQRYHWDASQSARFDKPPVKALVIACNTATAYGLEDVRNLLSALQLPVVVVGVVEAGARGLLEAPEAGAVGVLATVGTCSSEAYPRAIQSTRGLAGRAPAVVTQQGSAALAGVIEGDPNFAQSLEEQIRVDVAALVRSHQESGAAQPLAKVILGCTHFPLVQPQIGAALATLRRDPAWANLIAPEIHFIDPAEWTARELFRALARARLRRPSAASAEDRLEHPFFISIPQPSAPNIGLTAQGALESGYKYGRQAGELSREDTIIVPLTLARLPDSGRRLIETRLPQVWEQLQKAATR